MTQVAGWGIADQLSTFVGKLDLRGYLVSVNAAALEAANLVPEDVLGKPFWECYWWQIDAQTSRDVEQACRRALAGERVRYDVTVQVAGGAPLTIDFQMVPVFDSEGRVDHVIPSGQDITDRVVTQQELSRSRATLEAVFEALPLGLTIHDLDYRYLHINRALAEINGLPAEAHLGKHPNELFPGMLDDETVFGAWDRMKAGDRRPITMEMSAQPPGANMPRDYRAHYFPVIDAGAMTAIGAVVEDVTDRKRVERDREIMAREMSHRVKNVISTVQAISRQTARTAGTLEGFSEVFQGRLSSLAASHSMLYDREGDGREHASVSEIFRMQMKPYVEGIDDRLTIRGQDFMVGYDVARGLSLAVHELATNSAKYGALSQDAGTLDISWDIDATGGQLLVSWVEAGDRPVTSPATKGFGTMLIDLSIEESCGGTIERVFNDRGLTVKIAIPDDKVHPARASDRSDAQPVAHRIPGHRQDQQG